MTTEERLAEITRKARVENLIIDSYRQTLQDNTVDPDQAKEFCQECLAIV